ncbi:aquaporin-like protein [Xylona heveae TC161]|uniref:Aquaporin-like protein n=1 Tax=Xylona heveae (strain CBS 132557 / TC161) TaxID=1328760 RepID=A0A165H0Y7_XYLHT|nr:aquaporin-like protein [Xylona heveae TC161]KZF22849.1 aquaporin-like protein [Xylona heveae TC161]
MATIEQEFIPTRLRRASSSTYSYSTAFYDPSHPHGHSHNHSHAHAPRRFSHTPTRLHDDPEAVPLTPTGPNDAAKGPYGPNGPNGTDRLDHLDHLDRLDHGAETNLHTNLAVSTGKHTDVASTHASTSATATTAALRHRRGTVRIIEHPYAGRLGANQEHAVASDDPEYAEIVARTPDAAPFLTWREALLDWKGFGEAHPYIYHSTIIPALIGSAATTIILPLLIFAAAPVSGGHLNPLITISTFFAQISTLPRTLLYVVFQMLGGVIGASFLRAGLGRRLNPPETGGCTIHSEISYGSAFALELIFATTLLFLAFGTALDPRQNKSFGPALAPMLVGLAFGICGLASGLLRAGYTGASLNPARCFGLMSASSFTHRFNTYHWIHWIADVLAAGLNALVWALVPVFRRKI